MSTNLNQGGQQSQGVGSPITNEAYNVVSALHAKLEGLEAYRKYAQDGDQQVWQQLTQQDIQSVQVLITKLEDLVKQEKFCIQQPGHTH